MSASPKRSKPGAWRPRSPWTLYSGSMRKKSIFISMPQPDYSRWFGKSWNVQLNVKKALWWTVEYLCVGICDQALSVTMINVREEIVVVGFWNHWGRLFNWRDALHTRFLHPILSSGCLGLQCFAVDRSCSSTKPSATLKVYKRSYQLHL